MSYEGDIVERNLVALAERLSDRGAIALAVLLYGGIGLALPLGLGWPVVYLVVANVIGTSFAGLVLFLWLAIEVRGANRRHLVEWTTNLRLLTSKEFEWLVGEVFRREAWQVTETGRQDGPDGNIDLEISRGSERVIVQCKRWASWHVGVDEIRKFSGTLLREGLPGSAGIFVTLSDFSAQARLEAKQVGLSLIDNAELYARVEAARRSEPCPACEQPMVFGRSDYGWWLRCVAAGCKGKRDLSADPGRAIELMTRSP
jgi:restriction system protein